MKKIMSLMLGLSLLTGTAVMFGKDTTDTTKTTKTKKAKTKKSTTTTTK